MTIVEILNGSKRVIKDNFKTLAGDYRKKTGRKVCGTCPSDVQLMILTLKNIYNMTQFRFKRGFAMYKNKKGDKETISNGTMTDARALEFLKTKPERIDLFSEYPSNWKELLKGTKPETAAAKTKRLAAEAEIKAAAEAEIKAAGKTAKSAPKEEAPKGDTGSDKDQGESGAVDEGTAAAEKEALKEGLLQMKLADLRERYPDIKATSITDFVEQVVKT